MLWKKKHLLQILSSSQAVSFFLVNKCSEDALDQWFSTFVVTRSTQEVRIIYEAHISIRTIDLDTKNS